MTDYRDPWGREGRSPQNTPYGGDFPPGHGSGQDVPPYALGRWQAPPGFGYQPPIPGRNPYKRMLRHNSNAICAGLTLFFAVSTVVVWFVGLFAHFIPSFGNIMFNLSPVGLGVFDMILNTLSLLIPALLIAAFLRMPLNVAFPMRRTSARLTVPGVFCTLGMSMVGMYISMVITSILYGTVRVTATSPDFSPPTGGAEIMIYLIAISVIPGIFEEVLCRGVVMQSLRRFGDGFALVTSSLLFAMLHRNLLQGPNAFVTGMLLGYFTLRSGSLVPAIIMHFVNNFIFAFTNVVMMHMPARYAQILNFSAIPVFLALGAVGVILMVLLNGGFTPLHRKATGLEEPAKYGLFFTAPLAILFIIVTIVQTSRFLHFG